MLLKEMEALGTADSPNLRRPEMVRLVDERGIAEKFLMTVSFDPREPVQGIAVQGKFDTKVKPVCFGSTV